ncbi:uncharacterized protein LOC124457043 [Xenia sp. Carnegie-2017]|uniref:uncharacterized protein LOC124457043 n=1 Tax=Xenia sp. Carnegie-2017 TaxID=2897299 RepID=UPI001F04A98E|nr:uncharacterized protein LOC124457043 [Xenia sp. Carnegie-2017]
MCRALVDSGAGSSYASAKLVSVLGMKPADITTKQVDMLLSSSVERLETYATKVESLDGEFGVDIQDGDTKAQLPVHVVLGEEYARIKTKNRPRIGKDGEPIAELTKLGWFVMSPGKEFDHNHMLLTQTTQKDYEKLCRLDVLGLADTSEHDQTSVYGEFKEQLVRSSEGWYESGLLWRVYDASARATPSAPSLNDCLYPGPPLQNKLWSVLVHHRSFPVALCGDIEKAFLQIRIKEQERDALRFHWKSDSQPEPLTYRFTRVVFGLTCSPFLLGGVLEHHLETWKTKMPDIVEELKKSMYVDDLLSGGQTVDKAKERKRKSIDVFNDANFNLHKWNSNAHELEADEEEKDDEEETLAKQQLGTKSGESKVLGLEIGKTKREVLSRLAQVYDPLGITSPLILEGKIIYRDICKEKLLWDVRLSHSLKYRWDCWESNLPCEVSVPRSLAGFREPIKSLELHAFGDASTQGVGAAVYSVIHQESGTTQILVAGKSRLAKEDLTVPRLELVSAHMAANLLVNVRNALDHLSRPQSFAWLDSTVALHWILGRGQYKQFVSNRVRKIHQHPEIKWRYVPTSENPADLASRGGKLNQTWLYGPEWLSDMSRWPTNITTTPTTATEAEATVSQKSIAMTTKQYSGDVLEQLLRKCSLKRALRVSSWLFRFVNNCTQGEKRTGPLSFTEIEEAKMKFVKQAQKQGQLQPKYEQQCKELNLTRNTEGILECRGRIVGQYPIYLPTDSLLAQRVVEKLHRETLHGGVGLTMAAVRETYWIPKLRSLVKKVRKECFGCKRYRATSVPTPSWKVTRGPDLWRNSVRGDWRRFRGTNTLQREVKQGLQSFETVHCSEGKTQEDLFRQWGHVHKTAKWIDSLRKEERLQGYLEEFDIKWQFNLFRAPWWGGQFERLIGIVKQAMYKAIGGANLKWEELCEVILDVEVQINRRPLSYVEDDVQLPVLTPKLFLFQRSNHLPEQKLLVESDPDLRKRARYLKSCKQALWKRWSKEYLTALRERHNMSHGTKKFIVNVGDVVLIKSNEKNRGKWPLGIVIETYPGRDGVIRGSHEERPDLNPDAQPFKPKRKAAENAAGIIKSIADEENEEI